jgi:hypothetical protein
MVTTTDSNAVSIQLIDGSALQAVIRLTNDKDRNQFEQFDKLANEFKKGVPVVILWNGEDYESKEPVLIFAFWAGNIVTHSSAAVFALRAGNITTHSLSVVYVFRCDQLKCFDTAELRSRDSSYIGGINVRKGKLDWISLLSSEDEIAETYFGGKCHLSDLSVGKGVRWVSPLFHAHQLHKAHNAEIVSGYDNTDVLTRVKALNNKQLVEMGIPAPT